MSTEPQRTCPSCGNEVSAAMEFCPVCMLRKGLAGGVESGESSASEDTVKYTAERAAQAIADAPAEAAISIPGAFAGTPEFASPEQFAGVGVDIRSDLYSLGVVLWEMVTGHVMFRGSPC